MIRRFCPPAPPLISEISRMRRFICSTPDTSLETHAEEVATLMRAFHDSAIGLATKEEPALRFTTQTRIRHQ